MRFSWSWNKVERTTTMGFVNRMDQSVGSYRIGIRVKKWLWSLFLGMVNVVPQGAWILCRINKGQSAECLPFPVFWNHIFSMEFFRNNFPSHVEIRNTPSYAGFDDAKHYQTQSEHRRTQNIFKYLR